jgi:hypothetical protein
MNSFAMELVPAPAKNATLSIEELNRSIVNASSRISAGWPLAKNASNDTLGYDLLK